MRTFFTVITILIMAQLCFGSTGDVKIHLNGGDDVAYVGDTNTIEIWIKNDTELLGIVMPFEFSIGRNYQFISSGSFGYVNPEGDAAGAIFDGYHGVTVYVDNISADTVSIGGVISPFDESGLPIHNTHTLCYTMQVYIPSGQNELMGGFCVDNISFGPQNWSFHDEYDIYAPDFQGNLNSSPDDPDAPPICFDIAQTQGSWYWKSPYSNYAPHTPGGMPDFDQKQDSWQTIFPGANGILETQATGDDIYNTTDNCIAPGPNCHLDTQPIGDDVIDWSFSGPVALANCFWWFDSKYADSTGYPGDGMDQFPLVQGYHENAKAIDQQQPNWGPFRDLAKVRPGCIQSFVPTQPVLDAVQIGLSKSLEGLDTVEVCIYDQLPTSLPILPLGCMQMIVDAPGLDTVGWFQFHFDPAISLLPGETYFLTVQDIQDQPYKYSLHWHFADDNAYIPGTGWTCDNYEYIIEPFYNDWAFKTEYYVSDALDDHAFENVPYLIEDLAGKMQTCSKGETDIYDMQEAIYAWFFEKGLNDIFVESTYIAPDFEFIEGEIERSQDVILQLGFYDLELGDKVIDQEQPIWDGVPFERDVPPWYPGNLQSFIPDMPILDAVQLLLWDNMLGPTTVEVSIYDTYPEHAGISPIGTTSMLITFAQNPEWFQFHFPSRLDLMPGQTYYIAVRVLDVLWNIHWCYSAQNPYPGGIAYFNWGEDSVEARPEEDFAFKTEYYEEECVRKSGRYVTCAGVDSDNYMIALSDPYQDIQNPSSNNHNDAQYVSHDQYTAMLGSPCPSLFYQWWLPDYSSQYEFTIVENAVVICPIESLGSCGDANGDGLVNVSDAVHIINYVFVGGDPPDPIESGDVNCDGTCNVSDAVWIINYVFVGGNEPCDTDGDGIPDCSTSQGFLKAVSTSAELNILNSEAEDISSISVGLNSDQEVQGIQLEFEIVGNTNKINASCAIAGIQLFEGDFDGLYKVGLLDLKGQMIIPAGNNEILSIEYQGDGMLDLVEAILVGTDGREFEVVINSHKVNTIIPDKFSLSQNFPNPFNPSTKIGYSLPNACDVSLDIFNILGQEVATIVDNHQDAGIYTVTWDSRNNEGRPVSSGVYFYKLTAGDMVQIKKMVLMK
jgi:Dockerin type I domain/FlgD Ig-like domain